MGKLHVLAFFILIAGGLNWLALGVTGSGDIIGRFLGGQDARLARVIYVLVGVAAVFELATHRWRCKDCAALRMEKSQKSRLGRTQPNGTAY